MGRSTPGLLCWPFRWLKVQTQTALIGRDLQKAGIFLVQSPNWTGHKVALGPSPDVPIWTGLQSAVLLTFVALKLTEKIMWLKPQKE